MDQDYRRKLAAGMVAVCSTAVNGCDNEVEIIEDYLALGIIRFGGKLLAFKADAWGACGEFAPLQLIGMSKMLELLQSSAEVRWVKPEELKFHRIRPTRVPIPEVVGRGQRCRPIEGRCGHTKTTWLTLSLGDGPRVRAGVKEERVLY